MIMPISPYTGTNKLKDLEESLIFSSSYLFVHFYILRNESSHLWFQRRLLPREPNTLKAIKVLRNPFIPRKLCSVKYSVSSSKDNPETRKVHARGKVQLLKYAGYFLKSLKLNVITDLIFFLPKLDHR